jgi:hypothetical protein
VAWDAARAVAPMLQGGVSVYGHVRDARDRGHVHEPRQLRRHQGPAARARMRRLPWAAARRSRWCSCRSPHVQYNEREVRCSRWCSLYLVAANSHDLGHFFRDIFTLHCFYLSTLILVVVLQHCPREVRGTC